MKYRPEIDGLRAIAVIPVLIFHLSSSLFPSGFIGVDIFFAISGYLIAYIVINKIDSHSFSLKQFWARRVKRLFPTLLLISTFSLIAGYFIFLPDEFAALGKQVAALFLMIANINLWQQAGYWSPASEDIPLLHTWSLGVEEQFYIVFVIALTIVLKKFSKKTTFIILISGFILSFILSIYISASMPSAAFYLLPTRAWELLAGSLVAFLHTSGFTPHNTSFSKIKIPFDLIGIIMIITAFLIINKSMAFPGYIAILPITGACLLLWDGQSQLSQKLLASKAMVYIGKISYSLYLWHWILIVYFSWLIFPNHPTNLHLTLLFIVCLLVSSITYHFFENPLRISHNKNIVKICLISTVITIVSSIAIQEKRLEPLRNKVTYTKGVNTARNYNVTNNWKKPDTTINVERLDVVVLGSSHALMHSPLIKKLCDSKNLTVAFLGSNGSPSPWLALDTDKQAKLSGDFTVSERFKFDQYRKNLIQKHKPKVIITLDHYADTFNNKFKENFTKKYTEFVIDLRKYNSYVITIEQPPIAGQKKNLVKYTNYICAKVFETEDNKNSRQQANKIIKNIFSKAGDKALFVKSEDLFTNSDKSIRISDNNGILYYKDNNHLNDYGSQLLKNRLTVALNKIFP
ncbi:acyltransferase family protein [Lentisphaera araneosa]|nr:acyltransferase family protein [Lentisphaera araneosa]